MSSSCCDCAVLIVQCWLFSRYLLPATSYLLPLTSYLIVQCWVLTADCLVVQCWLFSADCSALSHQYCTVTTTQLTAWVEVDYFTHCSVLIVLSADFSVLLFSPKFCCVDCSLMTVVTVCRLQSLQLDMVTLYLERGWARLLHPAFQSLLYHFSPCQQ